MIEAMKKTSYDGVTGHQTFDANGDTENKSISIYTLGQVGVGDGWKYLTAITPASTTDTTTPASTMAGTAKA